jgi:hypothetical protein
LATPTRRRNRLTAGPARALTAGSKHPLGFSHVSCPPATRTSRPAPRRHSGSQARQASRPALLETVAYTFLVSLVKRDASNDPPIDPRGQTSQVSTPRHDPRALACAWINVGIVTTGLSQSAAPDGAVRLETAGGRDTRVASHVAASARRKRGGRARSVASKPIPPRQRRLDERPWRETGRGPDPLPGRGRCPGMRARPEGPPPSRNNP